MSEQASNIIAFNSDLEREIFIKGEFRRKKTSGARIALANGLTRQIVNRTVAGKGKSRRVRRIIAEAIGMEYTELWGEE